MLIEKLPVLLDVWREYDEIYPPLLAWLNRATIEMAAKDEKIQTKIRQDSLQWTTKYEKYLSLAEFLTNHVASTTVERVRNESDDVRTKWENLKFKVK